MQHTSACWDGEAVSIVVECLCQREDYSRAMECAKALHSVGVRPTAAAQIALVRLHSSKGAPGAAALENLVAHWYSSTNRDSTMWDDEHWRVAVEVLTAYSKANNGVEVTELLRQLHDTRGREYSTWINEVPHRAFVFLLHRKVIREPFARDLCFLNPLHLEDLADHPELLSVVILYANYTNSDVFDDLRQLSPNASVFEKVCKFIVEEGGRLSTKEKLDVLGRLSHCWGMEVPSEVKSWLELLGSINK
ncbi:hypothetical protein AGDE_11995 [Angomonas deanei]|uniref:Uncharacterized protein n=1 Tax=Angomonas deanei TaxID=59799 RepID=A0A7G2CL63_9TRYP|nr:hypothetical protein AGDE_11995 [Angomonas deanei]CAD2220598.1 hypothetical protein, conserved [Angomonas deanei]|eukprot:EPY25150.1 hypothetical protein AGDE_11995 [Angomonas deanei]